MTLDKFGRHIQKHIIKRHLQDRKILQDILKHPSVGEVVGMQIKKAVPPVTQFIITIYSDGTIHMGDQFYKRSSMSRNVILYKNQYYQGKILSVHYSNPRLSELHIHGERYDPSLSPTKPYEIRDGTQLYLKHIGPLPLDKTEAVYAEILVEGNVKH